MHQGDRPGAKGVYHSNAVDQVTQWEIVSATARISEAWLKPVLAAMMRQFPGFILGFHSDNGSEFIHRTIAHLLNFPAHIRSVAPASIIFRWRITPTIGFGASAVFRVDLSNPTGNAKVGER